TFSSSSAIILSVLEQARHPHRSSAGLLADAHAHDTPFVFAAEAVDADIIAGDLAGKPDDPNLPVPCNGPHSAALGSLIAHRLCSCEAAEAGHPLRRSIHRRYRPMPLRGC